MTRVSLWRHALLDCLFGGLATPFLNQDRPCALSLVQGKFIVLLRKPEVNGSDHGWELER